MTNPYTLGHISSSFHDQNAKQKHPKNQKQPARPYAKSSFRLKMGRVMGQKPHWPETLHTARLRYAKRFLDYLRRARKTRRTGVVWEKSSLILERVVGMSFIKGCKLGNRSFSNM